MSELDEWAKKQAEPLGLFDLANQWSEALKVVGAGNGAGLITAGAALSTFSKYPMILSLIKVGGVCFFVGVAAFGLGFASIQLAIFAYDEMLHGVRNKDASGAARNKQTTSAAMKAANRLAVVSALAFSLGLIAGLLSFLSFSALPISPPDLKP
jgi:hypothetical protein